MSDAKSGLSKGEAPPKANGVEPVGCSAISGF
jgi:hypothetical protein